jgi:ParB/RepB/Spo0J family partition protein
VTAPRSYTWGWSHMGGALPGLTVAYGVDDVPDGLDPIFGGYGLDGAVPDERLDDDPWRDGETWPDYVHRSFEAAAGDRRHAIPRIIATHALGRTPTSAELAAVARLTRRQRDRRGDTLLAVLEADVYAALESVVPPPPDREASNQENPTMPTTTDTSKPTAPTSAPCPVCGLDVDLVRGKIKPHAAKGARKGTANNCPGAGQKPPAAPSTDDESSTPAEPNGQTADVTIDDRTLDDAAALAKIEATRPDGAWAGAEAVTLDPGLCDPDPHNPRRDIGDVADLALSLQAQGMLEPIIVAPGPTDGRFTIVAGHRRVAAARLAGLPEVPALVRADLVPGSNLSIAAQVVENLHRLPLTALDEARSYDLLRQLGMKQTEIAAAVGVNQGQVSKRLQLLKLPDDLAARVGVDVDIADAVELSRLPGKARAAALTEAERGADLGAAVRRAKAAADRQAEHDALTDDLEQRGVALVDFPAGYHWTRDREDRPLATGSDGEPQPYRGARTLDIPYVDHADLPCHGAAVSPRDEVVYVCLDPTRHGYPTVEQEAAADEADRLAAQEAREAAAAARDAAVTARRQAARTAALVDAKRPQMTDTIAGWVVAALRSDTGDVALDSAEVVEVVADALELDLVDEWDLATVVDELTDKVGALRLAYIATVLGTDLLLDQSVYYVSMLAGSPLVRDHFARLAELAGYEPTADEARLIDPPADDDDVLELPDGDPLAGALAWYHPDPDALLEGDEARWIVDEAELDALLAAGVDHRLIRLEQPVAPVDEPDGSPGEFPDPSRTDQENSDPSPVDDAPPDATPESVGPRDPDAPDPSTSSSADGLDAGQVAEAFATDETRAPDAGDVVVPGERCPASRRAFNVAGNAEGIACPMKCGALISTTATGRVRDHDAPEVAAVE